MRDLDAQDRDTRRRVLAWIVSIGAVIGGWALLYLFLSFDEALSPATRACLQQAPAPPDTENLFLAILGLNAPNGLSPEAVGRDAVDGYERALSAYVAGEASFRFRFPGEEVREAPLIRSLCDPAIADCVASYLAQAALIERLAAENETLLANYERLARFDAFSTVITPHLDAPVPPTRPLVLAQRLMHARSVVRMQRHGSEEAARAFAMDLAISRHLLAQSDHLVLKMTAAAMVLRSLHMLAQVADAWTPLAESITSPSALLMPVTAQELSLASSLCGEFRLLSSVFLRPEAVIDMARQEPLPLADLSALSYKPNATVNLAFDDLHDVLEKLDALSPDLFAERYTMRVEARSRERRGGIVSHLLSWPWNPVGNILVNVARPHYERWYTRLYDLEGLRRSVVMKLLVRKHALGDEQLMQLVENRIDGLEDPYRDSPLRLDLERRVIGFAALSPAEEERADAAAKPDDGAGSVRSRGRWEVEIPVLRR